MENYKLLLTDDQAKCKAKKSVVGYYEVIRVHKAIKDSRIDEAIENGEINLVALVEYFIE